jgi:HPt (histidine-containing phosphotransfer) domain-containing protein
MTDQEIAKHFDRIKAERYIGKDPEVMKQFISLIKIEIGKSISKLEEAINLNDIHELKRIGHRLKGATLTAGMQILSEFAIKFSEMTSFNQKDAEQNLKNLKNEAELVLIIMNRENT